MIDQTKFEETEEAYCKTNLFLDVIRRRNDGYHDIGTLFQTLSFSDTLCGSLRNDGVIAFQCDHPATERPEQDLTWKAARALQLSSQTALGAELYLTKRLPSGAGLGGGSADAAAALRLLNRLWKLHLSTQELEKIGATLGADVPFLIHGGTAFAEGIGERLERTTPPPPATVLVVTPLASVSTAQAYRSLTPSGEERWKAFQERWRRGVGDLDELGELLFNKFEESVPHLHPSIAQLSHELKDTGACGVLLSGSGASIFALYNSKERAIQAKRELKSPVRYSEIGSFINR